MKYIVERNDRYWVDGFGWATTDHTKASTYTRDEAAREAHKLHGFLVPLSSAAAKKQA